MKIAIIGAGNVGSTIGRRLAAAGHDVIYAVRQLDAYEHLLDHAQTMLVEQAVTAAEAVILSTPWAAAQHALAQAGDFQGKPLFDATNPIGPGLSLTHGHDDSGAEQVQRWAPTAHVVKLFNSTGVENMRDPSYPNGSVSMFYCGDDDGACALAATLCDDLGFDGVHIGPLDQARILEPVAMLWIRLAMARGYGRDIAWSLMRR